jgi:putative flippase GtrA
VTASAEPPIAPGPPGLLLRLIRDQRVAFLIVGVVNTVVGFAFFVGFDLTLGHYLDAHWGEVAGSLGTLACAHVAGVLSAFVLYRRFVFRVKGHVWRDLARFESVYLVALGINSIALPALVGLGANRIFAQAGITLVLTVLSYFGHRNFSFRRSSAA